MGLVDVCDVCGATIRPQQRFCVWAVVTCGSEECDTEGRQMERRNRAEWRDACQQDEGLNDE